MSRAFYVAEHEVTEKQYQQIVGKGKASNLPVTNVTWIEAVRFCNELSKREGLKPYYTIRGNGVVFSKNSDGYRLPSESEWEWVSRKFRKEQLLSILGEIEIKSLLGQAISLTNQQRELRRVM